MIPVQASLCIVCEAPLPRRITVRLFEAYLTECSHCGSWTYFPRATAGQQASIHDNSDYFEHPYFELRRSTGSRQVRRCRLIFAQIGRALNLALLRGKRVLDVGCDTGVFLSTAAAEFGIVPVGVDVAAIAIEAARRSGIEAYHTTIEEAPESLTEFTAITAIDLIEHVSDPKGFLREVFRRLRPGGVVYLETPNIRSAVYSAARMLSYVFRGRKSNILERVFPPQHIQYFTRNGLAGLARECSFEVAWLGTRALAWDDIAASAAVCAGMAVLQQADRLIGSRILLCTVLRRPV